MAESRKPSRVLRGRAAYAVVGAALFLAATLGDRWAYAHLGLPGSAARDWDRMLRAAGYLPTWLLVALGLGLVRAGHQAQPWRRRAGPGLTLACAATLAGAAAELVKILVRRERPNLHDGAYVFRAWSDRPWSTSDLGLPSSHAAVAFGAAFLLTRLWPRGGPVWLALAAGCALTRLFEQAHFLSDVTLAAVLGYGAAWACAGLAQNTAPGARPGAGD
jgi:membrane-associated phospholipid phosphatase